MKLYKRIAQVLEARKNCYEGGNSQWLDKWEAELLKIEKELLPSGSGFDSGTNVIIDKNDYETIVLKSAFHVMNSNGYYERWIEFTVTVKPSLLFDFDLSVKGNFGKNQDLKEYIIEEVGHVLASEYKI